MTKVTKDLTDDTITIKHLTVEINSKAQEDAEKLEPSFSNEQLILLRKKDYLQLLKLLKEKSAGEIKILNLENTLQKK
jgi:hypothetical protein